MIPYDYKILDGILEEPSYYIYTCNMPTDSLLFRCRITRSQRAAGEI